MPSPGEICRGPLELSWAGESPALRELGRVVKPGGLILLLEYVRPQGAIRHIMSRIWQPWIGWVYGASFDRQTEQHIPEAGLELVESRYVVDDLLKLLTLASRGPASRPLLRPTECGSLTRMGRAGRQRRFLGHPAGP